MNFGHLLLQAGQRLTYNGGHVSAAAVAYYALVSLFPLLLLLLSGLGFVIPASTLADRLIRYGADLLPGTGDFLRQSLQELVAHRESLGLTALVTFYWSASGAFNALARSLDLVWDTPVVFDRTAAFAAPVRVPSRVGLMRRLRALAVVAGVGLLLLVSVLATTYLRVAERLEALPRVGPFGPETAEAVLSAAPVAVTAGLFMVIYALIPRRPPRWPTLWPGTVVATVLFEAAKGAFAWYAMRLRRYAWVYGSVTTAIVLLVWFYVVALIVLYGAEVGAVARAASRPGTGATPAPPAGTGATPALGPDPSRLPGPGRPGPRTSRHPRPAA